MTDVPRRSQMLAWTPAERLIHAAKQAVESAGCHPLLTNAVVLLGQAQDKVADFVDHRCTCGADRTGPSAEAHSSDCPAR